MAIAPVPDMSADTLAFLETILPAEGLKCAVRIVNERPFPHFCKTHEELAQTILRLDALGGNVYHGCAAYGQRGRKKTDVVAVRSFWLDIDVAPKSSYEDAYAAAVAVYAFCERLGIRPPLLVGSGRGLHVYWPLTEPIDRKTWERYALGLKGACEKLGLEAGPERTADCASILRPPGAHHRKGEPRLVECGPIPPAFALGELVPWLDYVRPEKVRPTIPKAGSLGAKLTAAKAPEKIDFEKLADRCAQFGALRETKGNLAESIWHATMVVLAHCHDGAAQAHAWSNGHPTYSFEETEGYLARGREKTGPTTCAHFQSVNAAGCKDCPYDGKVKTPLSVLNDVRSADAAPAAPERTGGNLRIIRCVGGELPRMSDEAEGALILAGFPIFVRAGALVKPVTENVPAAKGRTTIIAKFRRLSIHSTADLLAQAAEFQRFDARSKKWVRIDPPYGVAAVLLEREGSWRFPRVAGVITTPTLRPDGTLLADTGYDPGTRLYLALDDSLTLPAGNEAPSREDALAALRLLRELLAGFPFKSHIDRAVALSGIVTAVVRGAMTVAPMHAIRAHTPGTGKSLLVDVVAAIATGRRCPVIAAGKSEEETEKRLGALLRDGVSIISIDNVTAELGGDALAQMTERQLIRVRILGTSEAPEFECRAAIFATGNNLVLVGDMTRRALLCSLDAGEERPELRQFAFDPIVRILEDRGSYVAAVLTIVRAYRAAGSPTVCAPIGSYGEWSDFVRAPLIWLGEEDPVESMETTRHEDPELSAIREFFGQLQELRLEGKTFTTSSIINIACERRAPSVEFLRPELRDLLLRVAGDGGAVSSRRLGRWLTKISGRVVDGHRLTVQSDGSHGNRFALDTATRASVSRHGGFGGIGG
ncbi:MAG: hypothetical protein ABR878_01030 [Roseiarcus sp.]